MTTATRELPLANLLAETIFTVEATDYEVMMLRRETEGELHWSSDNRCCRLIQVGVLDHRPVNITCLFETIDGRVVLFWDVVSQVSDYQQIEAWFESNCAPTCDGGARLASCNAMNFHHVVLFLKSLKPSEPKDKPVVRSRVHFIFRCRLCGMESTGFHGDVTVESKWYALNRHEPRRMLLEAANSPHVHDCDDGRRGIADAVGMQIGRFPHESTD